MKTEQEISIFEYVIIFLIFAIVIGLIVFISIYILDYKKDYTKLCKKECESFDYVFYKFISGTLFKNEECWCFDNGKPINIGDLG